MNIRTVCLQIHLWLGLAAGLVIAVVCLTGALLTFERELTEAMNPHRYRVETRGDPLPLAEALRRAQAAQPELTIRGVTVHAGPGRTLEMPIEGGGQLFVDPYDGTVIERFDYAESGWHTVMALHRWLLGGDVGKLIVGVSVLAFLAILITGVWVWWPKSRAQLRERTRITTRRGWRRLNFDLHVALGIWAAVFLFAMAFTGLQWSFKWFNGAMYAVAGTTEISREPAPAPQPGVEYASLDAVHAAAAAAVTSPVHRIGLPKEPGAAFVVRVLPDDAANDYATELLYVDPYRAEVVGHKTAADHQGGQRLRWWFHVIHFGTIGGWPTQLIWFIAALLGATFPITGALIWINRHRKRWARRGRARRAAA